MTDKLFDVEIVTPQKTVYKGRAKSVTVPGSVSSFQILHNHAPIVSSLELGIVKVVTEIGEDFYAITSGFVENQKNVTSIIVEEAASAKDSNAEIVAGYNKDIEAKIAISEDRSERQILQLKLKFNNTLLKAISMLN